MYLMLRILILRNIWIGSNMVLYFCECNCIASYEIALLVVNFFQIRRTSSLCWAVLLININVWRVWNGRLLSSICATSSFSSLDVSQIILIFSCQSSTSKSIKYFVKTHLIWIRKSTSNQSANWTQFIRSGLSLRDDFFLRLRCWQLAQSKNNQQFCGNKHVRWKMPENSFAKVWRGFHGEVIKHSTNIFTGWDLTFLIK